MRKDRAKCRFLELQQRFHAVARRPRPAQARPCQTRLASAGFAFAFIFPFDGRSADYAILNKITPRQFTQLPDIIGLTKSPMVVGR